MAIAHRPKPVKPVTQEFLYVTVAAKEQISPNFMRISFAGEDLERFTVLGFDQWFRLFIPNAENTEVGLLPTGMDVLSYIKFLTNKKSERAIIRNYTIRQVRQLAGQRVLDVDFVLHDDAGHTGPASTWARNCAIGDQAVIYDEGHMFTAPADAPLYYLASDETGLPAIIGVLAQLAESAQGYAVVELPDLLDKQEVAHPEGIELHWLSREAGERPGQAALTFITEQPVDSRAYTYSVGEAQLATGARKHWVKSGVPKEQTIFSGYWKQK